MSSKKSFVPSKPPAAPAAWNAPSAAVRSMSRRSNDWPNASPLAAVIVSSAVHGSIEAFVNSSAAYSGGSAVMSATAALTPSA